MHDYDYVPAEEEEEQAGFAVWSERRVMDGWGKQAETLAGMETATVNESPFDR